MVTKLYILIVADNFLIQTEKICPLLLKQQEVRFNFLPKYIMFYEYVMILSYQNKCELKVRRII